MNGPSRANLAVACLVVLAGCSLPFGGTPSPTVSPTPPPTDRPRFPPGITADGVENGTTLYRAHVDAITSTGYVAVGAVNTTVRRQGFVVDVRSVARIEVAPNATRYHERRHSVGGPVERREGYWSNGTVEWYRRDEGGEPEIERREPRGPRRIAGRRILLPFLRGGAYAIESINQTDSMRTVTLVATSMDDPAAVRAGLPRAAENVSAFRARLRVGEGWIRSLVADVTFTIGGTNYTHHVEYDLISTGNVSIDRPDWVERAPQQSIDRPRLPELDRQRPRTARSARNYAGIRMTSST